MAEIKEEMNQHTVSRIVFHAFRYPTCLVSHFDIVLVAILGSLRQIISIFREKQKFQDG